MQTHDHAWSLKEAFDKFGFDDGDGCTHSGVVADALEAAGFVVDWVTGIHNNYICYVWEVNTPGEKIEFDGYELPNWSSLPEKFREVLLKLDPDIEAEWKEGL